MHKTPHPLFLCSFRPFFLLTATTAVLFMLFWLALLQGLAPTITPLGGWTAWHAHELLYGVVGAATAGFVLTAVPEFTHTEFMPPRSIFLVVALWLLARLLYGLTPMLGIVPAASVNALFWLIILARIIPPCWPKNQRRHLSFTLVIALLGGVQLFYFLSLDEQTSPFRWLYLSVHLFMVLIIVAASRVSMSVVNNLVETTERPTTLNTLVYIARPPKRNLAIGAILLCALSEWIWGHHPVTAWMALAAMAALFHLLSDWHIGRLLLRRWSFLLYIGYWLMALSYAALAAAYFGAPLLPSAARHGLMIGAMGLFIFTIMCIVARIHSGLWLDRRGWIPTAAILLISAAFIRVMAGSHSLLSAYQTMLLWAGFFWISAFCLYGFYFFGILLRPRHDGRAGCAGPMKTEPATKNL